LDQAIRPRFRNQLERSHISSLRIIIITAIGFVGALVPDYAYKVPNTVLCTSFRHLKLHLALMVEQDRRQGHGAARQPTARPASAGGDECSLSLDLCAYKEQPSRVIPMNVNQGESAGLGQAGMTWPASRASSQGLLPSLFSSVIPTIHSPVPVNNFPIWLGVLTQA
jgi:hypothetical protein